MTTHCLPPGHDSRTARILWCHPGNLFRDRMRREPCRAGSESRDKRVVTFVFCRIPGRGTRIEPGAGLAIAQRLAQQLRRQLRMVGRTARQNSRFHARVRFPCRRMQLVGGGSHLPGVGRGVAFWSGHPGGRHDRSARTRKLPDTLTLLAFKNMRRERSLPVSPRHPHARGLAGGLRTRFRKAATPRAGWRRRTGVRDA